MTLADLIIIVRRKLVLCLLAAVVGLVLAGGISAVSQIMNPGPAYSATSWVTGTASLGTVKDIAQTEADRYSQENPQITWSIAYSDSKASVLIEAKGVSEETVLAAANAVAKEAERRAVDEHEINAVAKDAPKAVSLKSGLSLEKTAKYALAGLVGGFCIVALISIAQVVLGGYVTSAKQVSRAMSVSHIGKFDARGKKPVASLFANMKSAKADARVACVVKTADQGGLEPFCVSTESRNVLVCRLKTHKGAPQLISTTRELAVPANITPELAQRVIEKLEKTKWDDVYVLVSHPADVPAAQVLLAAAGVAMVDVVPFASTVQDVLDAQRGIDLAHARLAGVIC